MRRAFFSLLLLPLLLGASSPASAGGFDVRVGGMVPRANDCGRPLDEPTRYTLFQDICDLYIVPDEGFRSLAKEDWRGVTWGLEYNHVLTDFLEVAFHVDSYQKTVDTSYRDWERPDDGGEIFQSLRLNIVPTGVTLQLVPTSKRARVAPFVGGGVDLVYWKYQEFGDFVDFLDPPEFPIYEDLFVSSGWTFGFHATGGVRFYLNRDFALVVRGNYQWADATMGGDFTAAPGELPFVLDLSGASVTFGLRVRF